MVTDSDFQIGKFGNLARHLNPQIRHNRNSIGKSYIAHMKQPFDS